MTADADSGGKKKAAKKKTAKKAAKKKTAKKAAKKKTTAKKAAKKTTAKKAAKKKTAKKATKKTTAKKAAKKTTAKKVASKPAPEEAPEVEEDLLEDDDLGGGLGDLGGLGGLAALLGGGGGGGDGGGGAAALLAAVFGKTATPATQALSESEGEIDALLASDSGDDLSYSDDDLLGSDDLGGDMGGDLGLDAQPRILDEDEIPKDDDDDDDDESKEDDTLKPGMPILEESDEIEEEDTLDSGDGEDSEERVVRKSTAPKATNAEPPPPEPEEEEPEQKAGEGAKRPYRRRQKLPATPEDAARKLAEKPNVVNALNWLRVADETPHESLVHMQRKLENHVWLKETDANVKIDLERALRKADELLGF